MFYHGWFGYLSVINPKYLAGTYEARRVTKTK